MEASGGGVRKSNSAYSYTPDGVVTSMMSGVAVFVPVGFTTNGSGATGGS